MPNQLKIDKLKDLRADCTNCFGLCCVALPYAKSADFAFDKDGGTPCQNLQNDYSCSIHKNLRSNGFNGCTVYECFGAGQKVSQVTYRGKDWRENSVSAKEMFDVFPIMQQLHEMLCYLHEALSFKEAKPFHNDLLSAFEKTEILTNQDSSAILSLDIPAHRAIVNDLLLQISELVRSKVRNKKQMPKRGSSFIGAKMRRTNMRGANLRGALLIAADLSEADLRDCDFIGADMRDTDLSGADLTGSFFLTQAQVNSAKGDTYTKLPASLLRPQHW
ncbi:pentapeptide repeat-containing protein [Bacillus sp. JJ1609]|uniref:pentapeptide repeat-containing protein n=1 Tax=Bacillus sp. JJ1609 TaxID=3122977 RepID=UPI003000C1AE